MFDFTELFQEFNKPFVKLAEGQKGYWDKETGLYVPPTDLEEVNTEGIILPLNNDELRFDDGGTFTFEDRKIIYEGQLQANQTVNIDGNNYRVHSMKPYTTYSHFTVYFVKRVST
ncbi:hypothetical protein M3689_05605 [Alkalihalophilus marmarensis]|uniref:hypothetical protein n=1 Tax=Alkalihalophilus marmarensis TaxID=521377 RepID=UPI00203D31B6|nr:hypothetical protein [Alkalihalophilus marmarensis]MCM3488782.1 hypothetical protein [Alkalihalophilus marmarensis]